MRRTRRRVALVWLLAVAACVLVHGKATGAGYSEMRGVWPENWPEELEPFREQAESISWFASAATLHYIIEFRSREEFEAVWPAVLRLKTEGAPIRLKTVDPPRTAADGARVVRDKPALMINCPPVGVYEIGPDGVYRHVGPWSDNNAFAAGPPPSMAVERKSDGKWVDWEEVRHLPRDHEDHASIGGVFARVDLTLYVDGNVIDLNRTFIPRDTPIMDMRALKKD